MSLLNDMLNDLNKQTLKQSAEVLPAAVREHTASARVNRWLLFTSCASVICLIALMIYQYIPVKTEQIKKPIVTKIAAPQEAVSKRLAFETAAPSKKEVYSPPILSETVDHQFMVKKMAPLTPREWQNVQLKKALNAIEKGDDQRAIELLEAILVRFPASIVAREHLATLYLSQSEWVLMQETLHAGLAFEPHNIRLITLQARLLVAKGQQKEALTLLESFHPKLNIHPDYYALLAAILETLGRTNEASALYQALLKSDPSNGQYWLGLGIALERAHAIQQAITAYERARFDTNSQSNVRTFAENRLQALQG